MRYIADLHIHSLHSRATARNLDLENLSAMARIKGIGLLGTGDFTHPAWRAELREKLEPAEAGLFRLREDLAAVGRCQTPRFMLTTEISSIYKKDGRTRKNHNLVMVPGMEAAERLSRKLARIGNVASDGRPILGLDARDLLEIVLETSDQAFLVPAHIWTPWFSLFGSKSGFDTIEACFGDLSGHIFAAETGLSSDPPMNWRVSQLDRLTLISNSDAHSPSRIGREANLFDTEMSFAAVRDALENRIPGQFRGTIEFFPEEGKYHLDGHRKCGVRLEPGDTRKNGGRCPVCQRPLTLGVLHRVEELADRRDGFVPPGAPECFHLVPLTDILAEIHQVGPGTKTVGRSYREAIRRLGPELDILLEHDPGRIENDGFSLLAEAVRRMRAGRVRTEGGYDGEYGRIHLFEPGEAALLGGQRSLFALSHSPPPAVDGDPPVPPCPENFRSLPDPIVEPAGENGKDAPLSAELNAAQLRAVRHAGGPVMVIAGPGTGKTHTLTCRIAHLISSGRARPGEILAVTFTNRAAREMARRLERLSGKGGSQPLAGTFHGLCLRFLTTMEPGWSPRVADDSDRRILMADAIRSVRAQGDVTDGGIDRMVARVVGWKQALTAPGEVGEAESASGREVYRRYQRCLELQGICDFEDLLFRVVRRLEADAKLRRSYRRRFPFLFIDEYQDMNHAQYRLVRCLAGPDHNLFVIGDPDQSIYGFRGSDARFFERFSTDYPNARVVRLTRNYRSTETILKGASRVIAGSAGNRDRRPLRSGIHGWPAIGMLCSPSPRGEAVSIGRMIENEIGGTGFLSFDAGRVDGTRLPGSFGFSDFAVLFRTSAQGETIAEVLEAAGIPLQFADRHNAVEKPAPAALLSLLKLVLGAGCSADIDRVGAVWRPSPGTAALRRVKAAWLRNLEQGDRSGPTPGLLADQAGSAAVRRGEAFLTELEKLRIDVDGRRPAEALAVCARTLNSKIRADPSNDALVKTVAGSMAGGGRFFNALALGGDDDYYTPRAEKVSLMTMHAAKGMEFQVVVVAGCENGLIPFFSNGKRADAQEERRLFYVAMTRARLRLYVSWCRARTVHGRNRRCRISPFAEAIGPLLRDVSSARAGRPPVPKQMTLF